PQDRSPRKLTEPDDIEEHRLRRRVTIEAVIERPTFDAPAVGREIHRTMSADFEDPWARLIRRALHPVFAARRRSGEREQRRVVRRGLIAVAERRRVALERRGERQAERAHDNEIAREPKL